MTKETDYNLKTEAERLNILCFDVGDKRTGIASYRPVSKVVIARPALRGNKKEQTRKLIEMLSEESFDLLVFGMPLSDSGKQTQQSEKVLRFAERIARRSSLPIVFVDEYGTSEEAKQRFLAGSQKLPDKKAAIIDSIAASIILESYLNDPQSRILDISLEGEVEEDNKT